MPFRTATQSCWVLRAILLVQSLAALVCLTALPASSLAAEAVAEAKAESREVADEDLYLCYLIPVLYEQAFPAAQRSKDPDAGDTAGDALLFARTIREHAKTARIDSRVERLYADLLAVADLREQSLRSANKAANAIGRETMKRGLIKSVGLGAIAGRAAARFHQEYRKLNTQDKPSDDALISLGVGAVAAIGSAIIGVGSEIKSANEQEAAVREREMAELKGFSNEVDARARVTMLDLIRERRWNDVEPPGEAQTRRIERYQRAITSQRPDEIAFAVREALNANPRNYFLHLAMEDVLSLQTNRTSSELIASAKRLQGASRLVPDSSVYDDHRLVALRSSAWLGLSAVEQDFNNAGEKWQPNDSSKYAVSALEEVCRRAPKDEMPIWNLFRASAYLENRQVADAEALVPQLREKESVIASFAPGCVDALVANIQSVKGQPQLALDSLRKAVAAGFPVSKDWWRDADLNALRRSHPKEFAQLVAVQAAWTIKFGVLNDDVLLENKSGFELTNVRVQAYGRSANKSFDVVLIGERIPRGEVMQWKNVLSIPRDPGMKAMLEFTCDQTSRQTIAEFIVPR